MNKSPLLYIGEQLAFCSNLKKISQNKFVILNFEGSGRSRLMQVVLTFVSMIHGFGSTEFSEIFSHVYLYYLITQDTYGNFLIGFILYHIV